MAQVEGYIKEMLTVLQVLRPHRSRPEVRQEGILVGYPRSRASTSVFIDGVCFSSAGKEVDARDLGLGVPGMPGYWVAQLSSGKGRESGIKVRGRVQVGPSWLPQASNRSGEEQGY